MKWLVFHPLKFTQKKHVAWCPVKNPTPWASRRHRQKQANRLRDLSVVWPHKPGRFQALKTSLLTCMVSFFFSSPATLEKNMGKSTWIISTIFRGKPKKKPWNHHLQPRRLHEVTFLGVGRPPKIPVTTRIMIFSYEGGSRHKATPKVLQKRT